MSSAIGPGDWVECVDVAPRPTSGPGNLRSLAQLGVGRLYFVTETEVIEDGRLILRLRGVALFGRSEGFLAERFRPIYRPRADLIESLKAPAPEAVRELISEDA